MVNPKQLLHFYLVTVLKRTELYLLLFCAALVIAAGQTPENTKMQAEASPTPENTAMQKEGSPTPVVLSTADSLLLVAESLLGVPYRFAGKQPSGFDCSGFTRYVYRQVGLPLAATVRHQFQQGVSVPEEESQPGDLIFFRSRSKVSHVGIITYEEEGKTCFVHASTSRGVVTDRLEDPYFRQRLAGVRRILPS